MGVVIPFRQENTCTLFNNGEEAQILSKKHKNVLKERHRHLTKLVTTKDYGIIRRETLRKLETIRSSKEFVATMVFRVKILYQFLFDPEFAKSKSAEKAISAGLLYFITSGDFLSDNIPGLGYLDDAFIVKEVWEKFYAEISNYLDSKGLDTKQFQ